MNHQQHHPYTFVFDLGNVLIRWDPRNLYRKIFGTDTEEMEWFLANVCTSSWNEQQDAGRTFAAAIAELSPKFPQYAEHIRLYFERWPEMLNGPIQENVDLLLHLKAQGVKVYALSNWSTETFPVAQELFSFLQVFDGMVISGREGQIKPDAAIYQTLLQRFSLRADATVFIDDSEANIAAAVKLGIRGFRYEQNSNLRSILKDFMP